MDELNELLEYQSPQDLKKWLSHNFWKALTMYLVQDITMLRAAIIQGVDLDEYRNDDEKRGALKAFEKMLSQIPLALQEDLHSAIKARRLRREEQNQQVEGDYYGRR